MTASPDRQRFVAEQIAETKRIVLAIRNSLPQNGHTSVLLTSALPGEGKSLMASSLAAAAAQALGKVLALDMNWHRPTLHNWFDLTPWFGLDELRGAADAPDLARPSGVENLDLLPAPQAIQDLAGMNGNTFDLARDILDQCQKEYDLVVVDGAPVFPTNRCMMDPVGLAGLCAGVALVVRADQTPRQDVKRAQKVLETGGARTIGIIMNHGRARGHPRGSAGDRPARAAGAEPTSTQS